MKCSIRSSEVKDSERICLHLPVLLDEVVEFLDPAAGDIILDATLGGGGHTKRIAEKISPGGKIIAIEKDPETFDKTKKELSDLGNKIIFVNGDFRDIKEILRERGIEKLDGALFDLGISSFQIDDGGRGFSFLRDGPLDMRFDPRQALKARDVVNRFSPVEIEEILRQYGEERHAKLVAKKIVLSRKRKRIETTGELAAIIVDAVGGKYRGQFLHPAARTFQALRIFVNSELEAVEKAVAETIPLLAGGARICVISFHSLEDRIIKNIFRNDAKKNVLHILTKKPVIPSDKEIRENSRSRSAKLRAAEKVNNHEGI
ncbi:MAG: 16S rRNA (cytosine(1402)-N(4))-methyltransferase RsmH [Candidatus Omnitrophica bacterium]|nr:16S rRNA (cytosine(1402)-N(4))-methyltransferase RsmH [Candidatus Omnitrophota bacterium]